MNNIQNIYRANYSPNFVGLFSLIKSIKADKTSLKLLKEKGVKVDLCYGQSNRSRTNFGVAVLKYKGETYKSLIPPYLIDGGYYSVLEGRFIPQKVDKEAAAAHILKRFEQSGEKDMAKFLEENESIYRKYLPSQ
jgi:hypothetical protein